MTIVIKVSACDAQLIIQQELSVEANKVAAVYPCSLLLKATFMYPCAVDGTKVPKAEARYTYEVTLTNGKLPIQASANVYLKLTAVNPSTTIDGNIIPAISSYTCKQGSSFADTLDENKLKSDLAADAQIKCTFNVPLTGLDVRGTAPIFRVQASWLATSLSGSLYNKALLIPTSADTQTAPVYTGSTLTVGAPSLNSSDADDSTQYVLGECLYRSSY